MTIPAQTYAIEKRIAAVKGIFKVMVKLRIRCEEFCCAFLTTTICALPCEQFCSLAEFLALHFAAPARSGSSRQAM